MLGRSSDGCSAVFSQPSPWWAIALVAVVLEPDWGCGCYLQKESPGAERFRRGLGVGRLVRPYIFNLNNAHHSARPHYEGRRFHSHLVTINARIEYTIGPDDRLALDLPRFGGQLRIRVSGLRVFYPPAWCHSFCSAPGGAILPSRPAPWCGRRAQRRSRTAQLSGRSRGNRRGREQA